MDDVTFYEAVVLELERDGPRKGLWAKAFAKTGGNDNAAKALYIELRVAELKEDVARRTEAERQQRERQAAADAEIERQRREEAAREAEEAAPWLKSARMMRTLGMGEDQIRENLIGRGLKVSVAERVARQMFHGEKVHNEKNQPIESNNTAEPPDGAREQYMSSDAPATSVVSGNRKGPSGVGGWLFLLVAGMLVLGPLLGAGRINADIITAEHQYPALKSLPQWANFKAVTWWTFFAIAALSIYGGWGLVRGKDWSVVKRAKLVLWLVGPVGALVMGVIVPLATLGESSAGHAQFVGGLIASIIAAGIWTTYLSKSKRVRNTYGPPT